MNLVPRFAVPAVATALVLAACAPDKGAPAPPAPAPVKQARPRPGGGALPPELAPYASNIARSRLAYTALSLHAADRLAPWNSRLGGLAYLPKGQAYPLDPGGAPLALLAQLNFAEMPALEGYPSRGILQFFIAGGSSPAHIYGSSPDYAKPFDPQRYRASLSAQRYFRVIYHAQVDTDPGRLQHPPAANLDMLPISGSAALRFSSGSEPVSIGDYRFARTFGRDYRRFFMQFGAAADDVAREYDESSRKEVTGKVGGYSNPTQADPRASWPDEDWIVLLELYGGELGEAFSMMWGDAGTGAFYIRRADLARRDFSRVAYYWDNH